MEIFNPHANFDFIGKKNVFIAFSIFLVIGSLISIFKPGLKFGIDFSGGTEVQIQFNKSIDSAEVRKILNDSGFKDSSVQHLGVAGSQEFLIRLEQTSGNLKSLQDDVAKTFTKSQGEGSFNIKKIEMVGPRVGADLKRRGAWALFYSLIGILIYVALRFDYRFAPGGVVALLHDAIIPLGVFAVLGKKFDLTILAAILTIIGYSINDTIVIFDRIRELMKTYPGMDIVAIVNKSVNETMSRTILTSLTVFISLLAIFFFGGEVIHDFAFAMLIGVIVGTYSTIFIASPIFLFLYHRAEKKKA
ncbi:MAG: protein-export membrane protein SecF [Deltaproteobacteria bacterium GWA2_38_16]|nr:MAG: protein-export membrane protein SecF [Deltaproteobacteria bacterium GWA2_38_16]OGQ03529.1 MAG: protein-export membrane protein SecF [Deltaproteobacteria bacterium RIFCSPHIGHO2_02_FULL_38_15]OGQ30404.1 MAG: protein-export membrane protein SecF [Deltaproteobacteria bacterium RIFCSPLOWO2_01_FULL_38_9]HBQ21232.1 protein translocase subunit SecF [Deltaproteobacteria bacterium]